MKKLVLIIVLTFASLGSLVFGDVYHNSNYFLRVINNSDKTLSLVLNNTNANFTKLNCWIHFVLDGDIPYSYKKDGDGYVNIDFPPGDNDLSKDNIDQQVNTDGPSNDDPGDLDISIDNKESNEHIILKSKYKDGDHSLTALSNTVTSVSDGSLVLWKNDRDNSSTWNDGDTITLCYTPNKSTSGVHPGNL